MRMVGGYRISMLSRRYNINNNNIGVIFAARAVGQLGPQMNSRMVCTSSGGGSNGETGSNGVFSFESNAQQFLESTPKYVNYKCKSDSSSLPPPPNIHDYSRSVCPFDRQYPYRGCQFDFPRYVKEKHNYALRTPKERYWTAAEFAVLEHNEEDDDDLELVRVLDVKVIGAGPVPFTITLEAKHKNQIDQQDPPLLFHAVLSRRLWQNSIMLCGWKPLQPC